MDSRRSLSPRVDMSTPFSKIEPEEPSTMRKIDTRIELLPEPVRPTMPIFSPSAIVKDTSLRTSGSPSRYRML